MLSAIYAECRKHAQYAECRYAECHYVECRYAVVMLNFVMPSVVLLSVIMLSVVKLNVVARFLWLKNCKNAVPITAFYEMAKKAIGLTDFTGFN
jgi:hypothetical protein